MKSPAKPPEEWNNFMVWLWLASWYDICGGSSKGHLAIPELLRLVGELEPRQRLFYDLSGNIL